MFLNLCGPLKKVDDEYIAKFQPEEYRTSSTNTIVPFFCAVEAMNQIVCRSSSIEYYDSKPAFPCQIINLHMSKHYQENCTYDSNLILKATISKKGEMSIGECILTDTNGNEYAKETIWVTERK